MNDTTRSCSDCGDLDRRTFVKTVGVGALAASSLGLISRGAFAAPTRKSAAETASTKLYGTLTDAQRKAICLPWDSPSRIQANANWHITKPEVGQAFYTKEQQALVAEVFKGVTSEEGHERFQKQMDEDSGGFDFYSMAFFGTPEDEKFEWVLTGRHHTIRADGNCTEGLAFGGPMVYGHSEEDPAQNMFHYQTKAANEVFASLDTKQRERALLAQPPKETAVQMQGPKGSFPGIAASELSADQKELFEKVVKIVLAPYRKEDVDESMKIVEAGGGIDALRLAFYQQGDLKNDKVWDIWRVEGPTFVSHFRGAPHVHAYIHVGEKQA